jgi:alpha-beta hydrolase superfamily lysophospholipase
MIAVLPEVNDPAQAPVESDVASLAEAAEWLARHATEQQPHLLTVGRRYLSRAYEHLNHRIDRQLRDTPRLGTEQAALAVLKGAAHDLAQATQALDQAASWLRDAGKAYQASQTKQAASKARHAAEGFGA